MAEMFNELTATPIRSYRSVIVELSSRVTQTLPTRSWQVDYFGWKPGLFSKEKLETLSDSRA